MAWNVNAFRRVAVAAAAVTVLVGCGSEAEPAATTAERTTEAAASPSPSRRLARGDDAGTYTGGSCRNGRHGW